MRTKKRYLVFTLHSEQKVCYDDMKNAVWNSLLNFLGEDGLSEANVQIIKNMWSKDRQSGFIRCSSKFVDKVKVALALIHQIGDSRVIFQTTKVSGTIKGAK